MPETEYEHSKLALTRIETDTSDPAERSARAKHVLKTYPLPDNLPPTKREELEQVRTDKLDRIQNRLHSEDSVDTADWQFVKARVILFIDTVQGFE